MIPAVQFASIVASIPSPETNTVSIGQFTIYFYALCILAGMIVAALVTNRRLTARGGEPWVTLDIMFGAVLLGIVGARTYHVLTHWGDYVYEDANLLRVFNIQEGGIAIFGALLGGALGVWLMSRYTGIRFWSFADALVPGLLLAQAVGRLGNWFNQELFGSPTDLPWGLEIAASNPAFPIGLESDTLFHPTFLYEILWNALGVAVILFLEKRLNTQWGQTFAMYLVWYGTGRVWLELLRVDPIGSFFGLRYNMIAALLAVLLGLVLFIILRRRHPGQVPSVYRAGRDPRHQQHEEVSAETHYLLTEPAHQPTIEQKREHA